MITIGKQWKSEISKDILHQDYVLAAKMIDSSQPGKLFLLTDITVEEHTPGSYVDFLRLQDKMGNTESFIRAIFNAAWEAGLRPDGFEDTRREMVATQAHLQDMRKLAKVT